MLKAASTGDLTAEKSPYSSPPPWYASSGSSSGGNDVDYALQIRTGEAHSGEDWRDLFAFAAGGERNVSLLHSEQVFEKVGFCLGAAIVSSPHRKSIRDEIGHSENQDNRASAYRRQRRRRQLQIGRYRSVYAAVNPIPEVADRQSPARRLAMSSA